jgi:hypothetical protein
LVRDSPGSTAEQTDCLSLWMIDPPLSSVILTGIRCPDSQSISTVVSLVKIKDSVTLHVGCDLELAILEVGSSSVELLVGNTNGRPSLVKTSVASPHHDWVLIGVPATNGVHTQFLVLVRSEVSGASCNVSQPLGLIISTSPWLDDKLSSGFGWAVFNREDITSTCKPSDDA